MAGMAQATVVGNLGADPKIKFMEDGKQVCRLRVAVTDKAKKDGTWQDVTQWFAVSVWGKQAEHCGQYLQKGRQVLVQGRLTAREYQDKDGATKTALEVAADKVVFLGAKDGADRPPQAAPSSSPARPSPKAAPSSTPKRDDQWEDEELPF